VEKSTQQDQNTDAKRSAVLPDYIGSGNGASFIAINFRFEKVSVTDLVVGFSSFCCCEVILTAQLRSPGTKDKK